MKKVVLNYLLIAAIIISAAFTSCEKVDKKRSVELPISWFDGKITVKVENGDDFNSVETIKIFYPYWDETIREYVDYVYGIGNYSDGAFEITLTHSVSDKVLKDIEKSLFVNGEENFYISDKTALIALISPSIFYAYDGNNNLIGNFSYYKKDVVNHTLALFAYVNKNVTIIYTENYLVNMNLKSGWNVLYHTSILEPHQTLIEYSTKEVSGLKWYFNQR